MNKRSFLNKLKPLSIGSAMADMALLLLVFFMATTTTEPPKGVEVELPKAVTKGAEQDSIYITIARDSNIYYDGNHCPAQVLRNAVHPEIGRIIFKESLWKSLADS